VMAVRQSEKGLYDLDRLESESAFYSETILTYKAVGIRRKNP
jgi:hypothetical protein